MKKYFILLAIVLVGCKWRYDKVIVPEERAWGYTIMSIYKNSTDTFYQLNRRPFTWDEAEEMSKKEDLKSSNCVMSRPIEWDSVYDVVMRGTESRKKETINASQIWPACTGATIHMHNNLDSGKGYIFRKYQNKLPKKHIIDIDDYIKYSGITNPEIIDSLRQQELERILRELEQYNKPLMHKEK